MSTQPFIRTVSSSDYPSRRAVLGRAAAAASLLLFPGWSAGATGTARNPRAGLRHASVFDIVEYGAAGDGQTDCTAAIQSALDAASRQTGVVVIPPGRYAFRDVLRVGSDVTVLGAEGSLLLARAERQALMLGGDNITVHGVNVHSGAKERRSNREAHAISAVHAGRLLIERCRINGANAAGIYLNACTDFVIHDNRIENTLADTIHITGASRGGVVSRNACHRGGDDGIGVVSYATQRDRCRDISIVANTISEGRSRGVAIVGGERIRITANRFDATRWAGVYIASESSYDTYGSRDIYVESNQLNGTNPDSDGGTHACITVVGRAGALPSDRGDIENRNTRVYLVANTIRGGGTAGIRVDAFAGDLLAASNLLAETGGWGIDTSATDARLIGNRIDRSARGGISVGRACRGGTTELVANEIALGSSRTQPAIAVHPSELSAAVIRGNRIRYDQNDGHAFRLSGLQRIDRTHNDVNGQIVD